MRKKQGVIMLEVLILLNILTILIIYNSKIIISNLSKCDLYEIKEDIFYVNDLEYGLLNEIVSLIENNEEVEGFIYGYKEDLNINYEYVFSKNENLKFIIDEGKLYLKERFAGKTESIREIDVLFIKNDKEEVEIIFRPKLYKIFYMVE